MDLYVIDSSILRTTKVSLQSFNIKCTYGNKLSYVYTVKINKSKQEATSGKREIISIEV